MIVVECDTDEFLIRSMGFSRKKIKHEGGKGKVLDAVSKKDNAIGIIDEDPNKIQPPKLKNYIDKDSRDSIKLLINKQDHKKKVIQISPDLEHWLIQRAQQNRISLKEFNLPENLKEMHDFPHIEKNKTFQMFLEKLIAKDKEIEILKKWIKEAL